MARYALVTDFAWPSLDTERSILAEIDLEAIVAQSGEEDELVELAQDAEAILTNWKRVSARVLEHAPHCLTVARYGVGLDNIDLATATELGIIVSNVPDYCIDEVSDHALALLLTLSRRIVDFSAQTRAGGWDNQAAGPIHRLRGQTLGLVGYGRIARAVASKATAFGMSVLAYSPTLAGRNQREVTPVASLGELLERSDAVSLHAPLTESTRHMIGRDELKRMRPGALLINTARGALLDEMALRDALVEGVIGGAGLDVMDQEPPPADHILRNTRGVVMTPHAAFFSSEAVDELQRKAARNVVSVLSQQVPEYIVNPEVLTRPSLRMHSEP